MITLAAKVEAAVSAVCPVVGVSIGVPVDKQTWRIDFHPEATTQQRANAQAAVDAFDVAASNAADAAEIARLATDAAEVASAKIDNQAQTFLNFTPTQLANWITNNVSGAGLTLAQVKAGLDTALNVLGRIAQNAGRGRSLR